MKIAPSLLALALAPLIVQGQCTGADDSFHIEVKEYCNYTSLLTAFGEYFDKPGMMANNCANTAEEELLLLLNSTDATLAEQAVHSICAGAFTNSPLEVEFETSTGQDRRFVEEFYKGNTDWNEQTAMLDHPYDGPADEFTKKKKYESNLLQRDAHVVGEFHETEALHSLVTYPDYLPNFDQCSSNAVYCCWPRDRQANDGNGNCASPYDARCVDADPGDNTDLCFVDHETGSNSTGYETGSEGFFHVPFDDGNNADFAEGAIHCHGFGWADDANDPSHVYRGNNLFFISLFDHMHQRGYVENIPGAPMCACAEQMPTVTQSDCTQIEFEEQEHDFVFSYSSAGFTAKLDKLFIKFDECEGINEDGEEEENDLWSYMNQLYLDDKIGADKLKGITQKLVGDKNCITAEKRHMAEKGLVRGYDEKYDEGDWLVLAGRDALAVDQFYEKTSFDYLLGANATHLSEPGLLRRACPSCYYDHQWLYYKRLTPVPPTLDLFWQLKFGNKNVEGNRYGVDFLIYGSYDDAINDTNAWDCPNYKYGDGFPGRCAPGGTEHRSQSSKFNDRWGRPDVAWYAEYMDRDLLTLDQTEPSSDFYGLQSETIGYNYLVGSAYVRENDLLITASGSDMWGAHDNFRFSHEDASGDMTLTVKIGTISYRESWTKAGLMVRDSLAADSKYFSVILTGQQGARIQYRDQTGGSTMSKGVKLAGAHEDMWLKLLKRGDEYTGFWSFDGEEWTSAANIVKIAMDSEEAMGDLKVGLAVTSHHWKRTTEVSFSDYDHGNFEAPISAPTASPAPSHMHDEAVVGTTFRTIGSANVNFPSTAEVQGSKVVVRAATGDIWWKKDGIAYLSQPVSGDFVATVHVTSLKADNLWAKIALMARDSDAIGSKHVSTVLAPNRGTFMFARTAVNIKTAYAGKQWLPTDKVWLRLVREGDTFTGYRSLAGDTEEECDWYKLYEYTVDLQDTVDVGMAVASKQKTNYAIVEFDHFTLEQPAATRNRRLRGSA